MRKNPKNPLELYRKGVDFDTHFLELFWHVLDTFDQQGEVHWQTSLKYHEIIKNAPDVFLPRHNEADMTREEHRIHSHRMTMHYLEHARKVLPMSETLTNVQNCGVFLAAISRANHDSTIKIGVGL